MNKYDDFQLDMRKSNSSDRGNSVRSDIPSIGAICTLISGIIIGSVVTGCSDKCITKGCSVGCPVPSKDHPHHSCHKVMLQGGEQLRC